MKQSDSVVWMKKWWMDVAKFVTAFWSMVEGGTWAVPEA